ncbi:MAG: hypothetical protein R3C19_07115 [Planctomycetaceae bacterium]
MLRVLRIQFFELPMSTRFPFRYGIATLTRLPHLFVQAEVEFSGQHSSVTSIGLSADGLPPKWFTKDPDTSFEDHDLPEMQRVIRNAAEVAVDAGAQPTFFHWWRELYDAQYHFSQQQQIAPLLIGLGVSLIERAVLDAFCRANGVTVHRALRDNLLNVELGAIRPELTGTQPADFLPAAPLTQVTVRHTVGMADPLTDDEIRDDERPDDGLPHSLTECIRTYGLTHFKVKLFGDRERDHDRLSRLAEIFAREVGTALKLSLDGNENFSDIGTLREHWDSHRTDPRLKAMFDRSLLFVEQPLRRDRTFDEKVGESIASWPNAPPLIIDESDAELHSLPDALRLGYRGTSHKNCKGIIKGLANAATIAAVNRGRATCASSAILSAEDLGNVGPVALLQDLAVVATLGIRHVERNGHHYFAGLSMFPRQEQERVLRCHPDLYTRHPSGFPTLAIRDGMLALTSVVEAPFGIAEHPDVSAFT